MARPKLHHFVVDGFGELSWSSSADAKRRIQLPRGNWAAIGIGAASEHDLVDVELLEGLPFQKTMVLSPGSSPQPFARPSLAHIGVGAPLVLDPSIASEPRILAHRSDLTAIETRKGVNRVMLSRLHLVAVEHCLEAGRAAIPNVRAPWSHDEGFDLAGAGASTSIFVPFCGRRHATIAVGSDSSSPAVGDVKLVIKGLRRMYDVGHKSGANAYTGEFTLQSGLNIGSPGGGDIEVYHVGGTDNAECYEALELEFTNNHATTVANIHVHVEAFGERAP